MFEHSYLSIAAVDLDKPTQFSNLIIPAVFVVVLLVMIFIAQGFVRTLLRNRKNASEWDKLEDLFKDYELSNEEAGLLRTKLRSFRYGAPTIIFINKNGIEEKSLRVESYVNKTEILDRIKIFLKQSESL